MTEAQRQLVVTVGMLVDALVWVLQAVHDGFPERTRDGRHERVPASQQWRFYSSYLEHLDESVSRVLGEMWVERMCSGRASPWLVYQVGRGQ